MEFVTATITDAGGAVLGDVAATVRGLGPGGPGWGGWGGNFAETGGVQLRVGVSYRFTAADGRSGEIVVSRIVPHDGAAGRLVMFHGVRPAADRAGPSGGRHGPGVPTPA
jgi:hypothetical protein